MMLRLAFSLLTFLVFFLTSASVARDRPALAALFAKKSGCFLLHDLESGRRKLEYNASRCKQRRSPCSTFKIPLSLMAFDKQLITQDTVFKWDGKDKGRESWNRNQTPRDWIANSAVWVSQEITPKLGLETIQAYLAYFEYGNRDFSGGLTTAWLGSSLKISGEEQLEFLKKMATHKLPVSSGAIGNTLSNMLYKTLGKGWSIYGKTGSGYIKANGDMQEGWYVGFLKRDDKSLIFVTNFTDIESSAELSVPAGFRARTISEKILADFVDTEAK